MSPEVFKLFGDNKITDEQINAFAEQYLIKIKKESGIAGYNKLQKSIYLTEFSRCLYKKIFQEYGFQDASNISKEMQAKIAKMEESCLIENMRN